MAQEDAAGFAALRDSAAAEATRLAREDAAGFEQIKADAEHIAQHGKAGVEQLKEAVDRDDRQDARFEQIKEENLAKVERID